MVKINAGLTATRAERIETMKRQEKFPETSVFHFYNENPRNRITGDCTFRAIATALKQGWGETIIEMAEMSLKHGYALDDKKGIERYLASKGWKKHKQPKHADGSKFTGEEFCKDLQKRKPTTVSNSERHKIVAMIGTGHIVAIMDGKIWDIWDCSDRCIGNFWTK